MLSRSAAVAGAAALCLAVLTVLAPSAQAEPRPRGAEIAAGRHGAPAGARLGAGANLQLFKDLLAAWRTTRGERVTVAIIGGTAVDPATPGLAGKVTVGPLFSRASRSRNPYDSLIAAAVAGEGPSASHRYGNIGMAPAARVLSLRVSYGLPDGIWQADLARAIRYAVRHGARVVYLDGAGTDDRAVLDNAVLFAESKGVVVVSTGYRWSGLTRSEATFPNAFPGVLADKAVTAPGPPQSCARRRPPPAGSFLIIAPATDIPLAAANGNLYALCSYSSADAWLVSTVVLIKSLCPHLSPALVARAIGMSARDRPRHGYSPAMGFGVINPVGALHAAARLQHLPARAAPGTGNADPAARLVAVRMPGPVTAVHHARWKLAASAGAIVLGIALLVAAGVFGRRRRAASRLAPPAAGGPPWPPAAPVSPAG